VIAIERRYYGISRRPSGAQPGDEHNALIRLEKMLKRDLTTMKKPGQAVSYDACYILPFDSAYIDAQIALLQAQIDAYTIARTLPLAGPSPAAAATT
jgi:hypothetical protein